MRRPLYIALLLLACVLPPAHAYSVKRVLIIAVPALRASDLTDANLPALRTLVCRSAVGWMNARTARVAGARTEPEEAAYLTLGAGSRATAGAYARMVTPASVARLAQANARLDHPVNLGALGDIARSCGARLTVTGNEDDIAPRRAALLLVCDGQGHVDQEYPSPTVRDDDSPYGIRDNLNAYRLAQQPSLQLWVFGDLARADRYAPLCLPRMARWHRARALQRLDQLIAANLTALPPDTQVVLLAPSPAQSAEPGDRLAPVLWMGQGVTPGLLTSGSTHTIGLVANTDLLPTVAAAFGVSAPKGMVGRSYSVRAGAPTADGWADMHTQWASRSRLQAVLGGLPTLQAVLLVAALIASYTYRKRKIPFASALSAGLALTLVTLPLALLVLPAIGTRSVGEAAFALTLTLLVAFVGGIRFKGSASTVSLMLCAGLSLVSMVDLLTGAHLMRNAWMSYSVMEGARYYGVGNEYCGALCSAALIAVGAMRHNRRWIGLLGLALLALLIGGPRYGANAGGFLGCAFGFGVAALVWWRGHLRWTDLMFAMVGACALLGGLLSIDLMRTASDQTHIAHAISGSSNLAGIVARKAALNGYLLMHSPWALGLTAAAVGLLVLRGNELQVWLHRSAAYRGVLYGVVAGGAVLFAFNDSGVVAIAQALVLFAAYLLTAIRLDEPTAR